ncbi:contactin-associated protein like 5-3 [Nematostella vectensis]|nr:contactin-associated protein like 5-3 [Nematostella vectensis]
MHIVGKPAKGCTAQGKPIGFPDPYGYVRVLRLDNSSKVVTGKLRIHLSFRTYSEFGTLIYISASNMDIVLTHRRGKLFISTIFGRHYIIERIGKGLADGKWHNVTVQVSRRGFSLAVDRIKPVQVSFWVQIAEFRWFTAIYLGFAWHLQPGFVGCMKNVKIRGVKIRDQSVIRYRGPKFGVCPLENYCFPNPCLNGGVCHIWYNKYTCDCYKTFYTGSTCEMPLLLKATCEGYNLSNKSSCFIDVDGKGAQAPFHVLCYKSLSGKIVTSIAHNKNTTQQVSDTEKTLDLSQNGVHDVNYLHEIKYSTAIQGITAVIEKSVECRQLIMLTSLKKGAGGVTLKWISRSGSLHSWVDGTIKNMDQPESQQTSQTDCDTINSLVGDDNMLCNFTGYLTDKMVLPVMGLVFSSDDYGANFQLGPLECFGSNSSFLTDKATQPSKQVCKPSEVSAQNPMQVVAPLQESMHNNSLEELYKKYIKSLDAKDTYLKSISTSAHPSRATTTTKPLPKQYQPTSDETHAASPLESTNPWSGNLMFLLAVTLIFLVLLLLVGVMIYYIRRKGCYHMCLSELNCIQQWKDAHCDDIAPPQESDPWMTINAGGYNVKTGKITYGAFV